MFQQQVTTLQLQAWDTPQFKGEVKQNIHTPFSSKWNNQAIKISSFFPNNYYDAGSYMHYMHILTSAHALTISTYALLPIPIKKIKNRAQNPYFLDQKLYCRLCWYRWRNPYHQRALHACCYAGQHWCWKNQSFMDQQLVLSSPWLAQTRPLWIFFHLLILLHSYFSAACSKDIWKIFIFPSCVSLREINLTICFYGLHNFASIKNWLNIKLCNKITIK